MRIIAVTPRSYFALQILLGTEQLPAQLELAPESQS